MKKPNGAPKAKIQSPPKSDCIFVHCIFVQGKPVVAEVVNGEAYKIVWDNTVPALFALRTGRDERYPDRWEKIESVRAFVEDHPSTMHGFKVEVSMSPGQGFLPSRSIYGHGCFMHSGVDIKVEGGVPVFVE